MIRNMGYDGSSTGGDYGKSWRNYKIMQKDWLRTGPTEVATEVKAKSVAIYQH